VFFANKGSNVDVAFYLNKGNKSIKKQVFELPKWYKVDFVKSDLEATFSSVRLYCKNVQFCGHLTSFSGATWEFDPYLLSP